jgi:hypothetical protein
MVRIKIPKRIFFDGQVRTRISNPLIVNKDHNGSINFLMVFTDDTTYRLIMKMG